MSMGGASRQNSANGAIKTASSQNAERHLKMQKCVSGWKHRKPGSARVFVLCCLRTHSFTGNTSAAQDVTV
jgi:hypothetical protein